MYSSSSLIFLGSKLVGEESLVGTQNTEERRNQAEWITRGLAAVYYFSVDTRTLVRAVDTDTQTHKSAYERRMNVAEAFRLSRPEQFVDKHVLLVDDVLTTGATLLSCIDCLMRIPRISISVFTLAFAL